MSSVVSDKHPKSNSSEPEKSAEDQEEIIDQQTNPNLVTSHLYLKPAHSTGTLDKEVVLRRIRHRKGVNNVKKAVQALLSSPFSSKNIDKNKLPVPPIIKWSDDAFAAP